MYRILTIGSICQCLIMIVSLFYPMLWLLIYFTSCKTPQKWPHQNTASGKKGKRSLSLLLALQYLINTLHGLTFHFASTTFLHLLLSPSFPFPCPDSHCYFPQEVCGSGKREGEEVGGGRGRQWWKEMQATNQIHMQRELVFFFSPAKILFHFLLGCQKMIQKQRFFLFSIIVWTCSRKYLFCSTQLWTSPLTAFVKLLLST